MSTLGNKNGPMNYLKDCLNLKREIDSTTPDVIHLFKPKGYGGICSIAESISEKLNGRDKKHSKGLFLDADDLEGFGGMNDIMDYPLSWKLVFQMQERLIPRMVKGVSVASSFLNYHFQSAGIQKDNIAHIPNCANPIFKKENWVPDKVISDMKGIIKIDDEENENKERKNHKGILKKFEKDDTVSLFTRFRDHDIDRAERIIKEIQKERQKTSFLIVGAGGNGEEKTLEKRLKKHLGKDCFHFTGRISPFKMEEVFKRSSISMVPMDKNNITMAKCSAKLVDLMYLGQAVVADSVGEIRHYIENEKSGLLVENPVEREIDRNFNNEKRIKKSLNRIESMKRNVDEFKEKIIFLLDNPDIKRKIGNNAVNRIRSEFSCSKISGKMLDFYNTKMNI